MILKKSSITLLLKPLLILGIIFFNANINYSQTSFCHTDDWSANASMNATITTASNAAGANFGAGAPVTLRVYYHVIRRTNGSGGYLPYEVQNTLDILQADYNPHGIIFAWDGCIDYIDSDSRYNGFVNNNIYNVNNHTDGIDIYLFPSTNPSTGGRANGVGVSSEFWVAGNWPGTGPVGLSKIISHEMGHVLFLWHTHHGCESGDWDLTDNSNCAFAGDFVCDTPADPHMAFNVDSNCDWTGVAHGFCSGQAPEPLADYTPNEELIMAYTDPNCMAYNSPGQGQRAYFAIQLMPYLQACVVTGTIANAPCDCPAEDITISQDVVIDQDLVVTGDLNIINGAEVTVTATIFMTQNHAINVFETCKFIVDGGKLTSCDATWVGVKVAGGNTDFDVKLTGAKVENTSEAAVSMDPPYPSPQNLNFGNGILLADNSTFDNVNSVAEFLSWSALPNFSIVERCTQNGGVMGITNENCQGITVRRNVFNNVSQNCIVSVGGSYTIVSNVFNSGSNDILYNNTSAGIGSLVDLNRFNGNSVGYRANGTTFSTNEITRNRFLTGFVDVWNDGANNFAASRNSFSASWGVVSFNNGQGVADVNNNTFRNVSGILTWGDNPDFNFFENCFYTTVRDVYIIGDVSPLIHSGISAANNCFTHQGNTGSSVPDIIGNPNPFTYIEPLDRVLDCRDVLFAPPAVNIINAGNPSVPCRTVIGPPVVAEPCDPVRELGAVRDAYAELQKSRSEVRGDTKGDYDTQAVVATLDDCLRRVRGILAELNMQEGQYEEARKLFSEDKSEDGQVYIYSTYLLENDLRTAEQYLGRIEAQSEAMKDFKEIQAVNLKRAPLGKYYVSSSREISRVKELATQTHKYAAYGKSLYYALTGEVISSELPRIEEGAVGRRSSEQLDQDVKVFPNPFVDNLTIELKGYDKAEIEITDFFGQQMYSATHATGVHTVNSDGWAHGIYIVTMRSDNEIFYQEKVILLE